ncbi:MAG: MerC domain-containing protein [Candidatus Tectomicrobia bacterium]|nr:MerC domain-containing protein [Candidatus Tectomicrobia bacterium]
MLSIVACYGTLFVISVLSLLGVSLTLHTGAWAGAIVLFAGLAVVGTALGYRCHRVPAPLILAGIGAGLIIWVMLGSFNRVLELLGFACLITAAIWDWRLKGRSVFRQHE